MHGGRAAHMKKNLPRAKSSVHALTRPLCGLERVQQSEFDRYKIARGTIVDRDHSHVCTPSYISRGVVCYVTWFTDHRQGDLTPQTGHTLPLCMHKLLLSDQREIPMGGRNIETRRHSCLAIDEAYGPAFTMHICTYV